MEIKRKLYLDRLVRRMHNGMIKVITGVRRCGKSYLLFKLFEQYLRENGVPDDHIIKLALDDIANSRYRNPEALYNFVRQSVKDNSPYYVLLDEVQFVPQFEDVLNGFLHIDNADTYVTGSNARFLSKDVVTEFRGRGDEVRVYPLSFSEFMQTYNGDKMSALDEYMTFGGLPQVALFADDELKLSYLKNLFTETYLKDIKERYHIRNDEDLEEIINVIASSIGSMVNPKRITDTIESAKQLKITRATVGAYLTCLYDSFLVEKAVRYDVKGRKYIDTPFKCYFVDCGLRNARLNFRQTEKTHLMENVVYNELRIRGYSVDVGSVPVRAVNSSGVREQSQLEVDFVCNLGSKRYYVQSAYRMPGDEKTNQEKRPLLNIDDSFRKIIVVGEPSLVHRDDNGITTMSIYDFLLNENSLDL